jgi:DNA-binding transcriptional MerR regulator
MGEILTTEVVAQKLGVSPRRIRQLKDELGLRPQVIGKALVFDVQDLKALRTRLKQLASTGRGKPRGKKE